MYTHDEWTRAVSKLMRLTRYDELSWIQVETPHGMEFESASSFDSAFKAAYKDHVYLLTGPRLLLRKDGFDLVRQRGHELAMLDGRGRLHVRVPVSGPVGELFDLVEKKYAEDQNVLADLLDGDDGICP